MATVIRFARHGTKKKPFFRIVVQDHRAPRDGKFIENIGYFNPLKGLETLSIERERLSYWLGVGAQMSSSVANRVKVKLKELQAATPGETPAAPAPKASKKSAKAKEA